jgi:hypothetical protein
MFRLTSPVTAGLISSAALWPAVAADGSAEDITVRNFPTYWLQDRVPQDDFLPPPGGYGPVVSSWAIPMCQAAPASSRPAASRTLPIPS